MARAFERESALISRVEESEALATIVGDGDPAHCPGRQIFAIGDFDFERHAAAAVHNVFVTAAAGDVQSNENRRTLLMLPTWLVFQWQIPAFVAQRQILTDSLFRRHRLRDSAALHQQRLRAQARNRIHIVADEKNRVEEAVAHFTSLILCPDALFLEFRIADSQHFVDDQNFRFPDAPATANASRTYIPEL